MLDAVLLDRQRTYAVQAPRLRNFVNRLKLQLNLGDSQFSILLTNDRRIQLLNRRFRHKNQPTDVLSFPNDSSTPELQLDHPYLGDIIISVRTAHRQARLRGHSLEKELRTLIIHGVLHLLGYDHETDLGQMRRKELRLQRKLL